VNVLVVGAHHDDLELGCAGTMAQLVDRGHRVVGVVMTDSGYSGVHGEVVRSAEVAAQEARQAAAIIGWDLVCLDGDTLDLEVSDRWIREILALIREHEIDTIFTHWHGDTHPPHQNINRMVMHASRGVPTMLGYEVNWHLGREAFAPTVFVPLAEEHWDRKIAAYRCYESETRRAGTTYERFHEARSRTWGLQCGAERAEAFIAYKLRWDLAG
jgi:LmbE family N-acetylglucosaminyl deacetylase